MQERRVFAIHGLAGLVGILLLLVAAIYLITQGGNQGPGRVILGIVLGVAHFVAWSGFAVVQPNEAMAVLFLGRYLGTLRENGWWWTIPLTSRARVSLRVRNFNSERLKVNDAGGSPIEIAAVVVFRVVDSAKALFDVEKYEQFVAIQSETALRHMASRYPYDAYDGGEESLRGNPDEVAERLRHELEERLAVAGVEVIEARLSHLAYAPEIAAAMLQRQQAAAIVAARQTIVEGAVGMVHLALERLQRDGTVQLDEERKANMASNLMVTIVSERGAHPVINAGSLY